jgi:hypothetical protein
MSGHDEMSGREGPVGGKKSDETWKEKAQREKDKLSDERSPRGEDRIPPASFLGIVQEFSLRSMLALGQIAHPATGEAYFDLEAAKYAIDCLGVLGEKTRGNLTPEEKSTLEDVLHGLRLAYLQLSKNPPKFADQAPDVLEPTEDELDGDALGRGGPAAPGPRPQKPGPKIIL